MYQTVFPSLPPESYFLLALNFLHRFFRGSFHSAGRGEQDWRRERWGGLCVCSAHTERKGEISTWYWTPPFSSGTTSKHKHTQTETGRQVCTYHHEKWKMVWDVQPTARALAPNFSKGNRFHALVSFDIAKFTSWNGKINKKVTRVHAMKGTIKLPVSHVHHFCFLSLSSLSSKTPDKLCNLPSHHVETPELEEHDTVLFSTCQWRKKHLGSRLSHRWKVFILGSFHNLEMDSWTPLIIVDFHC